MTPDTGAAEAAAQAEKERARKEKEKADNALRQERRDSDRPNRSRFEGTNPGFFGPRSFFAAA